MPPQATSGERRQRLKAEDRRVQIIAAAREIFIEQGPHGARSRMIAERAGITEAYLYRHFHSKEDLYRLAVEAPLEALIDKLRRETHELAEREGVSRADVLSRCHELFLECMVDIAPLVAASLFSNPDPGHDFYADFLFPKLRDVLELIIPDITGRPVRAFELDSFVEAMIGIHLTMAMEHLLEGKKVNVPEVARQITSMFAPGVPPRTRTRRPTSRPAKAASPPRKASTGARRSR